MLLSVIVPVGPGLSRIETVTKWLPQLRSKKVQVILVQDSDSENERIAFQKAVSEANLPNLIFEQVSYGNPGSSRNHGLNLASGKWIAFWDSDDTPNVTAFLEMVKQADQSAASYAIGGFTLNNEINGQRHYVSPKGTFRKLPSTLAAFPGLWRFAFPREKIQALKFPSFRMGEDQIFLIAALDNLQNALIFDISVYTYNTNNSDQLTKSLTARVELVKTYKLLKKNKMQYRNKKLYQYLISAQEITLLKNSLVNIRTIGLVNPFRMYEILHRRRWLKYQGGPIRLIVSGGLGNQLFQYSFAKCVAINRQVLVDTDNLPNKESELSKVIATVDVAPSKKNSKFRTTSQKLFLAISLRATSSRIMNKIAPFIRVVLFLLSQMAYGIGSKPFTGFEIGFCGVPPESKVNILAGYFQSHRYVDGSKIKNEIDIGVRPESREIVFRYQELAKNENPIVVHVRLGDYIGEQKIGLLSPTYFNASISKMIEKLPDSAIWLFSNDIDVAASYIDVKFRNSLRVINETGLEPAEVLQIMAFAKNFILGNSTFGWWAAALSTSPEKNVICPEPWFSELPQPKFLLPASWTKSKAIFKSQ